MKFTRPTLVCVLFLFFSFHFETLLQAQVLRDWNFIGIGADWSEADKWTPFGAPTPIDGARLGGLPGVENQIVDLDVDVTVAGLQILNGMFLQSNYQSLTVDGDLLISGQNGAFQSKLSIGFAGGTGKSLEAHRIDIDDGAEFFMQGDAITEVSDRIYNHSTGIIRGNGQINLTGNNFFSLVNHGTIRAMPGGLEINQLGNGRIDLDGNGNGRVELTTHFFGVSSMAINGTSLTDGFDGELRMINGSTLDMNLNEGWTLNDLGSLEVQYGGPGMASINGAELDVRGNISLLDDELFDSGRLLITAPVTFQTTSNTLLESDAQLDLDGNTVVLGGQFQVQEDAQLNFHGTTTMNGGDFQTHSHLASEGAVVLHGSTIWNGNVSVNGVMQQFGNATVTGGTTVNANVFDLDGLGNTQWNINHNFTLNADHVDSTISNQFDGTLNLSAAPSAYLEINLNDPASEWVMAGNLNLQSFLGFEQSRLGGSQMRITGNVNATGSGIAIDADTDFDNGSIIQFNTPDTSLVMRGQTLVRSGSTFLGGGSLINDVSGHMTIESGTLLDHTRLVNRGEFDVDDSSGIATVSAFENQSNATWNIDLGGYLTGDEHDLLQIADEVALLDGNLEISFLDLGNGLFDPQVGDEFLILVSTPGLIGSFDQIAITHANLKSYHWEAIYGAHSVTLRLASISIPEPAQGMAVGIVLFSLLLNSRRRR